MSDKYYRNPVHLLVKNLARISQIALYELNLYSREVKSGV